MIKTRLFKDKNYKAIYHNGKTLRIALDNTKTIEELDYPEFYDIKLTGFCQGKCKYCYQNSLDTENHYQDVLKKCKNYFGKMSDNEKPFQVALGGGNPNEHHDFIKVLELFAEMGITPNYTTNGMGLTDEIIQATKKYCGGVALSCHKHLDKYWKSGVEKLNEIGVKVNLHIIISDHVSVIDFIDIYKEFNDKVDYFVLLPYEMQGRAKNEDKKVTTNVFNNLIELMETEFDKSKIAFGANFYPFLQGLSKKKKENLDISLYEPEILSKYLDLKDMRLYKSSFNLV